MERPSTLPTLELTGLGVSHPHPGMNGESAVLALGQQNLTTSQCRQDGSAHLPTESVGTFLFNNRLYVADTQPIASLLSICSEVVWSWRGCLDSLIRTREPPTAGGPLCRFYGPQGILVVNTGM